MALSSTISLRVQARQTGSSDLGSAAGAIDWPAAVNLTNGTGAGQANAMWSDRRTLASGTDEDIDLSGVLANELGVTLTFTKIKAVIVHARPGNTTAITVSRPTTNGLPLFAAADGAAAPLPAGGLFVHVDPSAAGITVTAGTGDLINIANSAGAAGTYDIIVIGVV